MNSRVLDAAEASVLIGLVYDSALETNQWQSLMARLSELCPGHVPAVVTFDETNWVYTGARALPEGEQAAQIEDQRESLHAGELPQADDLHRTLAQRISFGLGDVISTRDVFSDAELHSFETYKTTMAPVGAGHWTAVHYAMSETRRAAIMLVENDWDDTPKDNKAARALLDLVAPHAVRAARFARVLTLAKQASETYRGFIDAVALPMIVTDSQCQIQMFNVVGQRLLDHGEIVGQDGSGRMILRDASREAALAQTLRKATETLAPQGLRIETETGAILICVTPFRPTMTQYTEIDRQVFGRNDLFAIFLGAQEAGPIDGALLQDVFELTRRESEICQHLLSGRSPAEIARDAERSEKTVRNQIQAVLEKVGVSSTRQLAEALSVLRTVSAMFDAAVGNGDTPDLPD